MSILKLRIDLKKLLVFRYLDRLAEIEDSMSITRQAYHCVLSPV
jgi:hypothetical protein